MGAGYVKETVAVDLRQLPGSTRAVGLALKRKSFIKPGVDTPVRGVNTPSVDTLVRVLTHC